MCHGTFDIVHPGHLRHLMYAKEKADLLIASVTADEHIMKANHRPYVPQELRAANLAALEMVDFVIVDPNPTPIEQMRVLQPDFFAKGYEYFANGVPPKTQEELDTLGRVRRRDGVHAWRHRLLVVGADRGVAAEPRHREAAGADGLRGDRLRRLCGKALHGLTGLKVHVVGDTIVDTYSYCSLLGATAKSPTFSVKHDFSERFAGGAAVVARHMKTAGADVTFTTVLGDDDLRQFVVDDLDEGRRPRQRATSTRPARRPTRSGSSPTATRCSRWTGWTTGASGRARWRR